MVSFKQVQTYCLKKKIKLTPLREEVLAIFCDAKHPLTAYDALNILRKKRANAEATTIYRVLDFLLQNALIHRIESTNSYFCCMQKNHHHSGLVLICQRCKKIKEVASDVLEKMVTTTCQHHHFQAAEHLIELSGLCEDCS